MDNMARKFVYREVMQATRVDRGKILDMWVDMGREPSKAEDKQLGDELLRLKRKAAHASALAKSVIAAADERVKFIGMLDAADEEGLQLVPRDDADDEDEEAA